MSHPRKVGAGFSRFSTAHKKKGLEMHTLHEDPPDSASDEQPVSSRSFHRQIAASIMQHHRYVDRGRRSLQPVSPASYSSSMELTPYNPAATPTSSLDYMGKIGDSGFSLKTSTELLKVLNRIWSLEEQHACYKSVVKGLKMEVENARMRIKDLLREKQMDRQVINDLMNQVAEQERLQSSLQSVKEELEEEKKLRKRSECLHRKLAREISEVKSVFSKALNRLEKERRARVLLEDLCDEFAMGIREYEQELRSLKQRTDHEQVERENLDSMVLEISEAWLDESMQMKTDEKRLKDTEEKGMILEKLRPEIGTFLKARKTSDKKGNFDMSMESFPLNEAMNASHNADDENDGDNDDDEYESTDSETNCFELKNNLDCEFSNGIHTQNGGDSKKHITRTRKPDDQQMSHKPNNLLRTNSSSLEGERIHPENGGADVLLMGKPKNVSKDSGHPESSSSRWPRNSKERTLKAKLLEARIEGRNSRSRVS